MNYIYDIILNFNDSKQNYEFYEWKEFDDIEHIRKIPVFKINNNSFLDIYSNKIKIDTNFLSGIYQLCEIYKNKKIEKINYACLFTNGKKVIGIEFSNDGSSTYRSSMLIDEEEELLQIANEFGEKDIDYKKIKQIETVHLTREEFTRKKFLICEFDTTYKKKDINKLVYLFNEYFSNLDSFDEDIDNLYQKLVKSLDNYNYKHDLLFEMLTLSKNKKESFHS